MSKKRIFRNTSPVCPLDEIHNLYPVAAATLVSMALTTIGITLSLPLQVGEALCFYMAGLIHLDKKPTSVRIVEKLGVKSHDRLTRLLTRDQWSCTKVMILLLKLALKIGGGYIIVDDVLVPKPRSCKMDGVYWDRDHAEGKSVYGYRLVVILWSNGHIRIPIAFALWHKKGHPDKRNKRKVGRPGKADEGYKSKNEIARTLLEWVKHRGLEPEYVTFDNWYASKENLKFIHRKLKWTFYTKLKCNSKLNWQGRRLQSRTIGRRLQEQCRPYRWKDLKASARCTEVSYGDLGQLTFVVVQHDAAKGKKRGSLHYLLTNEQNACARNILIRYRSRWAIEVFFRDCKQHLGLGAYQGRKLRGAYHHFTAVFLSFTCLELFNNDPDSLTLGDVKKKLQRLVVIKAKNGSPQLITLDSVPQGEDFSDWILSQDASDLIAQAVLMNKGLKLPKIKIRRKRA